MQLALTDHPVPVGVQLDDQLFGRAAVEAEDPEQLGGLSHGGNEHAGVDRAGVAGVEACEETIGDDSAPRADPPRPLR